MHDEAFDFFEQQAERGLLSRTGKSRAFGKKSWMPKRKEWEQMNGDVVVKRALPKFSSLRARLLYLMAGDSQTEFGKKIGVSQKVVSNWFTGKTKISDAQCRMIEAEFDLPCGWMRGEAENANVPENETEKQSLKKNYETQQPEQNCAEKGAGVRFLLALHGEYRGEEIIRYMGGLLESGNYVVDVNVREMHEKG